MSQEPFIPTRSEPHRFCEPMHRICPIAYVVTVVTLLFSGLGAVLLMIVAGAAGLVVFRVIHGGKTMREIIAEEHEEDDAAIEAYYEAQAQAQAPGEEQPEVTSVAVPGQRFVRPAWAWAAVASDTLIALVCFSTPFFRIFGTSGSRPLQSSDFLPVIPGLLLVVFDVVAHRMGTTTKPPTKPQPVYSGALEER